MYNDIAIIVPKDIIPTARRVHIKDDSSILTVMSLYTRTPDTRSLTNILAISDDREDAESILRELSHVYFYLATDQEPPILGDKIILENEDYTCIVLDCSVGNKGWFLEAFLSPSDYDEVLKYGSKYHVFCKANLVPILDSIWG